MRSLRTGIGLVGAIIPVAYCGWFVWYFVDIGGLDNPVISDQLQPTIIGLAIIGLLFAVGLGFKINRAFGSRPPGAGDGDAPGPKRPNDQAGVSPDADAMIARYLAQRAAGESTQAAAPTRNHAQTGPVTFGRRAR